MRSFVATAFAFVLMIGLSFSQGDAKSYFDAGETQFKAGNYDGALAEFTKAIAVDPNMLNAYLRRAFIYSVKKDYENTVKDYTKAIELKPDNIWAYISRGGAYNKLEKFNDALRDFDKALTIDGSNQEAYNDRGWAKQGLGDHKGACEDWKKSKKLGNQEAKIILKNSNCK